MMKTEITLLATAVIFAMTSNVAEAAKVSPNPLTKPNVELFSSKGKKKTCESNFFECVDQVHRDCSRQKRHLRRIYGQYFNLSTCEQREQSGCYDEESDCLSKKGGGTGK